MITVSKKYSQDKCMLLLVKMIAWWIDTLAYHSSASFCSNVIGKPQWILTIFEHGIVPIISISFQATFRYYPTLEESHHLYLNLKNIGSDMIEQIHRRLMGTWDIIWKIFYYYILETCNFSKPNLAVSKLFRSVMQLSA